MGIILEATIECPHCGYKHKETMPENLCVWTYVCWNCHTTLKPRPGDCCVFCSYSDQKCPSKQKEEMESHSDK